MPIANSYLRWPVQAPEAAGITGSRKRKMSRMLSPQEEDSEAQPIDNDTATISTREMEEDSQDTQHMSAEARMELMARIKSNMRPLVTEGTSRQMKSKPETTATLLPPIDLVPTAQDSSFNQEVCAAASKIERPRSALHRGDFRQDTTVQNTSWLSTSPTTPWYVPTYKEQRTEQYDGQTQPIPPSTAVQSRARAASNSSLSSSFIYRQPTSPLAVSSHVDEVEEHDLVQSVTERIHRRRTYSPGLGSNQNTFETSTAPIDTPLTGRESTFPRRSLSSFQHSHSFSFAPIPTARSRRPSFSPNASPIQHAPLVGRFEESILRGRMSSIPSRPLDFVAQIGVLGKGTCKASLRCPPHMTIPFPAVFYNYGNDRPFPAADEPSPYVGLIDLESQPSSSQHANASFTRKSRSSSADAGRGRADQRLNDSRKRRHKHRKDKTAASSDVTTTSNKINLPPPKGGYRIPEQGQLQIILKNPNKTAVKLFLVPYDLGGMSPGTKTFIRQRSFSAGPVVDMPLTATGGQPISSISNAEEPRDRPILRYLIHLHICCPSKGRFFLYKSIRVVFANRVPDGKERLRNEIQLPDIRFTPWKPDNDTEAHNTPQQPQSLLADALQSNPSAGIELSDPFCDPPEQNQAALHRPPTRLTSFSRTPLPAILSRATSSEGGTMPIYDFTSHDADSQLDEGAVSPKTASRPPSSPSTGSDGTHESTNIASGYKKLSPPRQSREGLLALQLRELASRSRSGTPDGSKN